MLKQWTLSLLLLTGAMLGADPAGPGATEAAAVIGDAIGADPVLRTAVLRWSKDHRGSFEIKRLATEDLTSPGNGCDAAVTDAADELTFGDAFTVIPYALEPVVVAVPLTSKLEKLTARELKRIYSGHIANWRQLGLEDQAILRVGPAAGLPGDRPFQRKIMGRQALNPAPPRPGDEILPGMIIHRNTAEAELLAAGAPGAIIFGSWELAGSKKLKVIAIDGVRPEAQAIQEGRYLPVLTRTAFCRKNSPLQPFLQQLPEIIFEHPEAIPDFLPPIGKAAR